MPDVGRIALLAADPELLRHVAPQEADRAQRALTVPLVTLPPGEFDPRELLTPGINAFAAIVVSGLIAREVSVGWQATLRLIGPGDVVHGAALESGLLVADQVWTATLPTRVALLGDRFLHAVRHWPRLVTALVERMSERHDQTIMQLAISQQPRVEDRIVALLAALAERWGRVTPDGVVISLSLTHEALGRLIGARRPTVTLALKALAADGRLERRSGGAWVLRDVETIRAADVEPLTGAARPRVLPEPVVPPAAADAEVPTLGQLRARVHDARRFSRHVVQSSSSAIERSRALCDTTRAARTERAHARGVAPV
jgi:CRP-like cAMP-binding protein